MNATPRRFKYGRDCNTITTTIVSSAFMMVMMVVMMMMMMMMMVMMMMMINLIDKAKGEKTSSSDSNARQAVEQQVPFNVIVIAIVIVIVTVKNGYNDGDMIMILFLT